MTTTLDRFSTYTETSALAQALNDRGIPADLYQDGTSGGLLCVIVPLKGDDLDRADYRDHVLISTEGAPVYDDKGRQWWAGVYILNEAGEPDETLFDASLQVPERTWFGGDTIGPVADTYAALLRVLRRP